jgi:hypothetical protein
MGCRARKPLRSSCVVDGGKLNGVRRPKPVHSTGVILFRLILDGDGVRRLEGIGECTPSTIRPRCSVCTMSRG